MDLVVFRAGGQDFALPAREVAEVVLRPTDPVMIQRLTSAGFAPGAGGFVRRIDGSF